MTDTVYNIHYATDTVSMSLVPFKIKNHKRVKTSGVDKIWFFLLLFALCCYNFSFCVFLVFLV